MSGVVFLSFSIHSFSRHCSNNILWWNEEENNLKMNTQKSFFIEIFRILVAFWPFTVSSTPLLCGPLCFIIHTNIFRCAQGMIREFLMCFFAPLCTFTSFATFLCLSLSLPFFLFPNHKNTTVCPAVCYEVSITATLISLPLFSCCSVFFLSLNSLSKTRRRSTENNKNVSFFLWGGRLS